MAKNLLVIGSGGREHAICWKLSQSSKVERIFALPGSPGIAQVAKTSCVTDVKIDDFKVNFPLLILFLFIYSWSSMRFCVKRVNQL